MRYSVLRTKITKKTGLILDVNIIHTFSDYYSGVIFHIF
jgi:hypothetical protein